MKKKLTILTSITLLLGGCSFFEEYDYDDYSIYQYDESKNFGLSYYESQDYQDDYYKGGVFQRHQRMEKDFGWE